MRDLIEWAYHIDATNLQSFGEIHYIRYLDAYFYIIPVGEERRTVFFHLLQFIQQSPHFTHVLTHANEPTLDIQNKSYYGLLSTVALHQTMTPRQLGIPVLYKQPFPLATHSKPLWIFKNQRHEQDLNLALDLIEPHLRNTLFDIATYYIHLNEEAYRLLAPLETLSYHTTFCHARVKPDTYLYEWFMPDFLTLDNRSRIYCEYIRHLFLETGDLEAVREVVVFATSHAPLTQNEWHLLYARLFFPAHFYDLVHELLHGSSVDMAHLYEQTRHYTTLLHALPLLLKQQTGITLQTPDWVTREALKR